MSAYNVLFLCTGNSARSIMAESVLNQLGGGPVSRLQRRQPPRSSQVNPHAIALLQRNHFKTDSLRSKNWSEFEKADAPHMNFVLTVCDKAAGEVCPVWPGQPMSAHWGVADPAEVTGSDEVVQRAFTEAFVVISRRIALMVNLPFDKLDRLALQQQLDGHF
jgi:protein-tyrosine-phosphatase